MAKSTGYYGLRRGSTKSHTYQVVNGKQITKDRQEGGKQPRTLAQMKQRCIIATAGSAYAALKLICDHSYEGVSAGLESMGHFHRVNDSLLRQSALRDNDGVFTGAFTMLSAAATLTAFTGSVAGGVSDQN